MSAHAAGDGSGRQGDTSRSVIASPRQQPDAPLSSAVIPNTDALDHTVSSLFSDEQPPGAEGTARLHGGDFNADDGGGKLLVSTSPVGQPPFGGAALCSDGTIVEDIVDSSYSSNGGWPPRLGDGAGGGPSSQTPPVESLTPLLGMTPPMDGHFSARGSKENSPDSQALESRKNSNPLLAHNSRTSSVTLPVHRVSIVSDRGPGLQSEFNRSVASEGGVGLLDVDWDSVATGRRRRSSRLLDLHRSTGGSSGSVHAEGVDVLGDLPGSATGAGYVSCRSRVVRLLSSAS